MEYSTNVGWLEKVAAGNKELSCIVRLSLNMYFEIVDRRPNENCRGEESTELCGRQIPEHSATLLAPCSEENTSDSSGPCPGVAVVFFPTKIHGPTVVEAPSWSILTSPSLEGSSQPRRLGPRHHLNHSEAHYLSFSFLFPLQSAGPESGG